MKRGVSNAGTRGAANGASGRAAMPTRFSGTGRAAPTCGAAGRAPYGLTPTPEPPQTLLEGCSLLEELF